MGDWPLTLSACHQLCPWFFVFGHTNYACWMPVLFKDMAQLPVIHPSIHKAFMNGKFVVQRSDKKFSLMALDQSQEHSIKFLKEDSGTKGLYGKQEENSKEVIELSKPEVLRVIDEYEHACFSTPHTEDNMEHPETSTAEQNTFLRDLRALLNVVEDGRAINPFKETGSELITLDSVEVMDPLIITSIKEALNIGTSMYKDFVRERIENSIKPLSDVIPRAKLYTFSNQPPADLKKVVTSLGHQKPMLHLLLNSSCLYKHSLMLIWMTFLNTRINVSHHHYLIKENFFLEQNLHY
ncbi:MAG: hypothetical protein GY702_27755 [Desulfobulbaceae bacterium]|nr:hypothetical protein [Desulfobulbaceae bacterium]